MLWILFFTIASSFYNLRENKISLTHYKTVVGLKDTYKLNCIGETEQIIKEFQYDAKTGKRFFEEWDYLSFLNTDSFLVIKKAFI